MQANSQPPNQTKTGAQIVVDSLKERGVTHVFGIPGAKIDAVFNTLVDSDIQTIVCRHEQNAAFIAGGIGRMTGRAGVAIATSGPGVSNLITGMATANTEGDPLVALGGAVATSESLKQIHQTMDSVRICQPVTKYSASVDSPETTSEVLSNAFRAAESGRPGAAFVSLPKDVMGMAAQCEVLTPPRYAGAGPAEQGALEEAARLINAAKVPVVFLGMMASKPQNVDAVRELIRQLDVPVVGTFQAAGAVSTDLFKNFGGRVGQLANQPGDKLLQVADLVITIGYNPVEYDPSIWNKNNARPIIHLDVLPSAMDRNYVASVDLLGDISATARALTPLVQNVRVAPATTAILNEIVAEREASGRANAQRGGTPIHPLRLVAELQNFMREDVTLCADMGSFHLWMARHLYSFRPRQFLITNGQQTLGVALPWAIAATIVRPHEKVLSISGDGGFLFSAMELETAVRLQSHLVHMVWIDGTYDMVAVQERQKYGRSSGTDFGPVDPVKYAEAFGAKGFMIRQPEEIAPVLKRAFDAAGPVIVGVHVDYRDNHLLFDALDERGIH